MAITSKLMAAMKLIKYVFKGWLCWWSFSIAIAQPNELSEQLQNSLMQHLLGHWVISDSTRDASGVWQDGVGASWHFYPILNGHAVQDDWISPALSVPSSSGSRQYGTNIRIYNPKKQRWEMAWASVKGQQVDTFVATETDSAIIMTGQFNGQQSKITFYDIKVNSFLWKLEFQQAQTDSWSEVYRIEAIRKIKVD